jgi:hypothetical protein
MTATTAEYILEWWFGGGFIAHFGSSARCVSSADLILADYVKEPRLGNIVIAMINGAGVIGAFSSRYLLNLLRQGAKVC